MQLFAGALLATAGIIWWVLQSDRREESPVASEIDTYQIGGGELELDRRMIWSVVQDEASPGTISKLKLQFSTDRILGLQKPAVPGGVLVVVVEPLNRVSRNLVQMQYLFADWRGREELPLGSLYTRSRDAKKFVLRKYFDGPIYPANSALEVLQPLELGALDEEYFFARERGDIPLLIDCMNPEMPDSSSFFGFFKACNLNRTYYDKFAYKIIFKRQSLEKWKSIDDFVRDLLDASVQNKNWSTGSVSDAKWSKYLVEP